MNAIRQNIFKKLCDSYETQAEFAIAINVTPGYVHQLYKGIRPITEKTALKIAKKLKLPDDFFNQSEKSLRTLSAAEYEELMSLASPTSHSVLVTLQQAYNEGQLTDKDLEMLNAIAERFKKSAPK